MRRTIACSILVLATLSGTRALAQQQSLFGGQGPVGQSGGVNSGASATGLAIEQGGPQITTELGGLSQSAGQAEFLGRNAEAAAFLGRGTAPGGPGGAPPDFRTGGAARGNANAGRGGGPAPSTRRVIRPVQRIAFDFPQQNVDTVASRLRSRIATMAVRRPELAGVRVRLDEGGTAVLSGTASSESAARLAAAMVRLEPGVRRVENGVVVGSN